MAKKRSADKLRTVLPKCFRRECQNWYSIELGEMEKDLLRSMPIEKWYDVLIKRFKTRTPRALELLQKERYTSVPRILPLARRPATNSQQDEYANRPFVPRSKLDDEEDQEMVPDPDGYYVEDLDLDYYNPSHQSEEENTPTALAISPVQACRRCQAEFQSNNLLHKHLRAGGYLPKPTVNTLPTTYHRGVEIITDLGTGYRVISV